MIAPTKPAPVLKLHLHGQQGVAFQSDATEILFGGAAGGGKSHLMRAAAIFWAVQIAGLQIYLFRRTVGDLYKNHFEGPSSFHVMLAPLVVSGHCRIVKNEIRFWNGSKIFLQHCHNESDVENYRGYEFHVLLIDELTLFTERMYRFLRARLRMTEEFKARIPENMRHCFPRVLASSNPGGPGHHFVKANWIDSAAPYAIHYAPEEMEDYDGTGEQPAGLRRQFIPAQLHHNPSLNRREYAASLRSLGDPLLVRAMLEGDWNVVAGSMFGDVWRQSRHICHPFDIPADWPLWRGADDGYAAAHCTLWATEDPETETIYCISELYGNLMLPAEIAARVKFTDQHILRCDHEGKAFSNGTILSGDLDSAAFADTGAGIRATPSEKVSRGDQMNQLGLNWRRARKWVGCRQHGWQHIAKLLAPNPKCPMGMPGLRFFPSCVNIIRTLPTVMRDKRDPEDIDDADDHAPDALRYTLQHRRAGFAVMRVL